MERKKKGFIWYKDVFEILYNLMLTSNDSNYHYQYPTSYNIIYRNPFYRYIPINCINYINLLSNIERKYYNIPTYSSIYNLREVNNIGRTHGRTFQLELKYYNERHKTIFYSLGMCMMCEKEEYPQNSDILYCLVVDKNWLHKIEKIKRVNIKERKFKEGLISNTKLLISSDFVKNKKLFPTAGTIKSYFKDNLMGFCVDNNIEIIYQEQEEINKLIMEPHRYGTSTEEEIRDALVAVKEILTNRESYPTILNYLNSSGIIV